MLKSLLLTTGVAFLATLATTADAFTVYWGQNSYGAANANDPSNWQKTLSYYCQDDTIDIIPIAFLDKFFSTGGEPEINLANICNAVDNGTFPGTNLANCQSLTTDINFCQSKGKAVTLSLGGAGGGVGFSSDAEGQSFADQLWNLFFGGTSSTRPFGSAVLDGIDLDIENGGSTGYAAFVNQLQSHFSSASKKYYVTGAPQCVYPDANLGSVINSVSFDAIYVQFYNNPCGLQNFNSPSNWNFGIWDYWARNVSPNKNVKVYIGAPASSSAAGGGYVSASTLTTISQTTQADFPSFGGIMLWDASQAYANSRYDVSSKSALTAKGSCSGTFTYPACSAPAYVSGSTYTANSQVSYNGYIWEAKWWSQSTPTADPNGDWVPTSTTTSSATTTSKTTTASATPTGSGTNCSGVSAWSSSVAYVGGSKVTYNGHLWTAKWWTQAETPSSTSSVWVDGGACSSTSKLETLLIPKVLNRPKNDSLCNPS
ncbi:class III chitinase [Umbelopsis sp. PMI_123]|nr:class III chitinase [Umbelopsis sp. PMI_123]